MQPGIGGTDPAGDSYSGNPRYAAWAAGGENFAGTPFAADGIWLTTSGLPQAGTIEFVGEPLDTLYTKTNVYVLRVDKLMIDWRAPGLARSVHLLGPLRQDSASGDPCRGESI